MHRHNIAYIVCSALKHREQRHVIKKRLHCFVNLKVFLSFASFFTADRVVSLASVKAINNQSNAELQRLF